MVNLYNETYYIKDYDSGKTNAKQFAPCNYKHNQI